MVNAGRAGARALFGTLVLGCLLGGVAGGLWRLGIATPPTAWAGQVLLVHAALMVCGFLGTVIALERATALRHRLAFLAPLASGAGALGLAAGHAAAGAWLVAAGAGIFTLATLALVRRQLAAHTVLLLIAAAAWTVGSLLFALGLEGTAVFPWWFSFLAVTVAAERLEMTRLMRHRPSTAALLYAVIGLLLVGAATTAVAPRAGGLAFGVAVLLLAAWLVTFDIARRTVRAQGLPRYMAVCLLGGYAWLAIAGIAWVATALGWPARDIALHALGLGFIVSMMMGHAPVVLPSLARIKLQFGAYYYVPLAMLHLSLVLRLFVGASNAPARRLGTSLNAVSLALFALVMVGSAMAWRRRRNATALHPPQIG